MNLGEFHSLVETECKRGTSLATIVPARAESSAKFLEKNFSMQYMSQFVNVTLNPSDPNPRLIDFPDDAKSIPWLKILETDSGRYEPVRLVDPRDMMILESGQPDGYWLSGLSRLVLNKTPDEAYVIEGEIKFYSSWPTVLTSTPWLCRHAPDLLLGQTMMYMARYLRDTEMFALYKQTRDESIRALMLAEEEVRYDGVGLEMGYEPRYGLSSSILSDR